MAIEIFVLIIISWMNQIDWKLSTFKNYCMKKYQHISSPILITRVCQLLPKMFPAKRKRALIRINQRGALQVIGGAKLAALPILFIDSATETCLCRQFRLPGKVEIIYVFQYNGNPNYGLFAN